MSFEADEWYLIAGISGETISSRVHGVDISLAFIALDGTITNATGSGGTSTVNDISQVKVYKAQPRGTPGVDDDNKFQTKDWGDITAHKDVALQHDVGVWVYLVDKEMGNILHITKSTGEVKLTGEAFPNHTINQMVWTFDESFWGAGASTTITVDEVEGKTYLSPNVSINNDFLSKTMTFSPPLENIRELTNNNTFFTFVESISSLPTPSKVVFSLTPSAGGSTVTLDSTNPLDNITITII